MWDQMETCSFPLQGKRANKPNHRKWWCNLKGSPKLKKGKFHYPNLTPDDSNWSFIVMVIMLCSKSFFILIFLYYVCKGLHSWRREEGGCLLGLCVLMVNLQAYCYCFLLFMVDPSVLALIGLNYCGVEKLA